jgi:DNA modification methylase
MWQRRTAKKSPNTTLNNCEIRQGDCLDLLRQMPDESVNCCITSPPYWGLRDYGTGKAQIGLEFTPQEYVEKMVAVFAEVKRVLRKDGTLWLNLGDSYCGTGNKGEWKDPKYSSGRNGQSVAINNKIKGLKSKDLVGIPWRVAFALQSDGWYLRQDIIWHKPNPMPESVTDRCTKAHEYIFLMSKSANYHFDSEAIREDAVTDLENKILPRGTQSYGVASGETKSNPQRGHINGYGYSEKGKRNKRSVWSVTVKPYKEAHFATFPTELITPCVLAGCPKDGTILDPFGGSGTTGQVALENGRNAILLELNPKYIELAKQRISQVQPPLFVE